MWVKNVHYHLHKMATHNQLGKKGEQLAKTHLQKLGYVIVEVNWRQRKYEIDIIAQHNNELVFVEVKTRSANFFERLEEVVSPTKQKHLINGADCYVQANKIDLECRFDVFAIVINEKKQKIKHLKNAFSPRF